MEECISLDSSDAKINKDMIEAFKDYFTEHTNPMRRIYHVTYDADKILALNEFRLTFAKRSGVGRSSDYRGDEHKNVFYLSCMRTTTGGYRRSTRFPPAGSPDPGGQTLFELDAYKLLADGYKIQPFNFFMYGSRSGSETEDRILSDSPFIKNANKYIDALHIYVPQKNLENGNIRYEGAVRTYFLAKKQKVQVFVYNEIKYFSALRREKNINSVIEELTNNGQGIYTMSGDYPEGTYPEAQQHLDTSIKVLQVLKNPTKYRINKLTTSDLEKFIDVNTLTFVRIKATTEYIHELSKMMRIHKALNTTHLLLKILGEKFLIKRGINTRYE